MKIIFALVILTLPMFAQAADSLKTAPPGDEWLNSPGMSSFQKACVDHDSATDSATFIIKRTGKNVSVNCQTGDGGSVSIAATPDEASISVHQTKQMNGPVDMEFLSFLIGIHTPSFEDCVSKVKKASDTGNPIDLTVKLNADYVVSTCDTSPFTSANPLTKGLKALGDFLSSRQ